ncbi:chemotaxis protein CheY [candidate division MSBL1 archaeon SCGC-AAA382M17]|uniref:Chemotaxis protein CheY n=1 Tax=candidate division MSBL1 archaeon SCGC-AAA382M17 TaxID=1698284 RepID=A0ABR5TK22_9EURY|nr:chemotaxis protein CheY [candidate division MSBL1 archaeon SCGC-AAA382M17]
MKSIGILWIDDEIDLLKPQILFLEEKGYKVFTVSNADDAIELVRNKSFDIILLDEQMPGVNGLEALSKIKNYSPATPIIMVTKSEEEDIMEEAIGAKIDDYLIKPVNPKQILLTIKKNVETKKIIAEKTISNYQTNFQEISQLINQAKTYSDWMEIYEKIVYWDLELEGQSESGMNEVLEMQKSEANNEFSKFIEDNYINWFSESDQSPLLSPNIMKNKVFPLLEHGERVCLILIDNFRYDHWKKLSPLLREYYSIENEEMYFSILPTATQYSRNSIFGGLMPLEISEIYPRLWLHDEEEGGKNLKEKSLLKNHIDRQGLDMKFYYEKLGSSKKGTKLLQNLSNLKNYPLSVLIVNYIDMLSHARTEIEVIKELASGEAAYRSLTLSWFSHSSLFTLIKELANKDIKLIITTDHGNIQVKNPRKVIGDKKTSVNLRYKNGKNLSYNPSEIIEINEPESIHLPKTHLSTKYIFCRNQDYFVYPNNYNYYVNYYKNTFQHGGISMEEMLIPFIKLKPKK